MSLFSTPRRRRAAWTALAVGLVLLVWLQQRGHFTGLAKPTRIVMDD